MKSTLVTTVAAAVLAAAPALVAAPAVAKPAATAAGPQISAPKLNYRYRQLANGLKVYTMRDPSTAQATVQMWYDVGSKDDPEGRSGFAHLFEHILSRKTVNMPLGTMNKLVEDVGGARNASTGGDWTNYYETVPAAHLETMLWTHAERMARPVVDEEVFKAEREIVKEELRLRVLTPPYGRLRFVVTENAFDRSGYRRPGIGSIEQISSATMDDLYRFHETYYRPDNAVLVVSGNFDQAQLDGWVDKYFAGIERPKTAIPRLKHDEAPRTTNRTVTAYAPNVALPAIGRIWRTVPTSHPDTPALKVLSAILARGQSSRLYQSLVYDKRVASSVSAQNADQEEAGYLAPVVTLASGKTVEEVEAALDAEIRRIREAPVTAAELAEAKTELAASELQQRETASGRAFLLGDAVMTTGDAGFPDKQLAAIQKVTAADVQRVAAKYLGETGVVSFRYLDESKKPADYTDAAWANPAPKTTFLTPPAATRPPLQLAAEGVRQAPPAPGATRPLQPPAFAERTLSNGLKVVVAKSGDTPIATLSLVIGGGASADPADRPGLAGMTASLLDKGTKTRSAPAIATEIERLGADLGAGAGADGSTLFLTAPVSTLAEAGKIMADVAINPAFDPAEVERTRKQSADGLAVAFRDPPRIGAWAVGRVLYGAAPYGAPRAGTPASLKAITRDELAAFHRTWWRPDNATLVIAGGLDADAAFRTAEALFGGWTASGPAPALPANRAGAEPAPRVVVIDLPGAGQAAVSAGYRGPNRADAGWYPLQVANAVLGAGSNGRLFQEVRAKRGLAYGAYSGLNALKDGGDLVAQAQTKNETAVEVADIFLTEFAKMAKEPLTQDAVDRRRNFVTGGFGRAIESSGGLAATLSGYVQTGLPLTEVNAYLGKFAAVTPDAASRAAAAEFGGKPSVVIVGDYRLFADKLKVRFPDAEVIPAAEFDPGSPTLRASK